MAKIGHYGKAIGFAKGWLWLKRWKSRKHAKKDTGTSLELLCEKNGFKKQLIFEKWQVFENGQNWPLWKGYRLFKRVTLAQNIKVKKTCEKGHWHLLELLCAKNGFKKQLIFETWQVFENGQNWPLCKGYRPWKRVTLAQKIKL